MSGIIKDRDELILLVIKADFIHPTDKVNIIKLILEGGLHD